MKAVFSFCTKFLDEQNAHGGFPDTEAFYCSCILSVLLARRNVGRVVLYTDSRGARLFERLQLPFDEVHLIFDDFPYPYQLWMASKLMTYRRQTEPFVHIDLDAYLWAPLPPRLANAAFIAQNSEENFRCYNRALTFFLRSAGYLPDLIRSHVTIHGLKIRAVNAGIYGGHDLATIYACCDAAFASIEHPANQPMFAELHREHAQVGGIFHDFTILLEQYFAGVCCHERQVPISYVLSDQESPYFTHLLSESKRHPKNIANLKARVARDYPYHYRLARLTAPQLVG